MIRAIHSWLSEHIHAPSNLDKLLLFVPFVIAWILTLPFVGLIIADALGIYYAISFTMDSVNIAICSICGLLAILHIIDIIGRVKGGSSDGGESSGEDSDDDSNPLL